MGFRFYKRIKIAPGLSINLGKRGASVSVGPKGAKMTFGPNGTRSSVGIPGTGLRYEHRFAKSTSGGEGASVLLALAIICGSIACVAFTVAQKTSNNLAMFAAFGFGAGAIACLLGCVLSTDSEDSATSTRSTYSSASRMCADKIVRFNNYIRLLGSASMAFYGFLREVNRSTRCRNIINGLDGMDAFQNKENPFTINIKLAAIAYCDMRQCFRKLGYDDTNLQGLAGIGYAMSIALLCIKGFDVNRFLDMNQRDKLLQIISEAVASTTVEVNLADYPDEYRFNVIFGMAKHEHELVQRYATCMYRWASLIAKADGTITETESQTLAGIMKMNVISDGENVRITNGGGKFDGIHSDVAPSNSPVVRHLDEESQKTCKSHKLDAFLQQLEGLIGLAPVKQEVLSLVKFIEIQRKRTKAGLRQVKMSYHCVFTGNPGTGKTTVARILADIYREMGILSKGHLVETDRSGLVAEYVGQTAVKTNKIIDSAIGGVLFIDEAYTLVQGGDHDYGSEAIATLLKRMEDDRERLVVVLAGYSDEMEKFIDSNPGLQSRFSRYITFPDYSADELAKMFLLAASKSQYHCDKDVQASIVQIMERAIENKDRNFGNGRFVRNLFERAIQRQAVRLSGVAPLTAEMLSELTLHDLGFAYED